MKRSAVLSIGLMLVTAPPLHAATFDVESHVARWVAMWSSYDLDEVDELFLADARVSYFSSEKEGVIRGIDALREHHRGFGFVPGGRKPDKELWVERVESADFGDTTIVTAIWYFGDREARDEAQHGPMTMVYVKENDAYRIAHMHFATY